METRRFFAGLIASIFVLTHGVPSFAADTLRAQNGGSPLVQSGLEEHLQGNVVTLAEAAAGFTPRVISEVPPDLQRAPAVLIILAAGEGIRLGSSTPKPAVKVHGKPMVRFAADAGRALGVPVVAIIRKDAEILREVLGSDVLLVQDPSPKPMGTASALLMAESVLKGYQGTVLVALGDMPGIEPQTLQTLLAAHRESRASATYLTAKVSDPLDLGRILRGPDGGFLGELQAKDAETFQRQGKALPPPDENNRYEVGTGAYAFDATVLFEALRAVRNDNQPREFYLPSVLSVLEDRGHRVSTVTVTDDAVATGVNDSEGLMLAERLLAHRTLNRLVAQWTTSDWIAALDRALTLLQDPAVRDGFVGEGRPLKDFLAGHPAFSTPQHLLGLGALAELVAIYGPVPQQIEEEVRRYLRVVQTFEEKNGSGEVVLVRAPGRGMLMGAHNDYNWGPELLLTLPVDTLAVIRKRTDSLVRLSSTDSRFPSGEFDIARELPLARRGDWDKILEETGVPPSDWANYLKGSILFWQNRYPHEEFHGMDLMVDSTLPMERGVSSSSALVVIAGMGIQWVNQKTIDPIEMAQVCCFAEWYVGTRGGGLDHAISILGKRGHALKLLPDSAEPVAISLPPGYRFVMADSLIPADKTGTVRNAFNQRSAETRVLGLALFKARFPEYANRIQYLRDITAENLRVAEDKIDAMVESLPETVSQKDLVKEVPDAVAQLTRSYQGLPEPPGGWKIRRRVRHIVQEVRRVEKASSALQAGDMKAFGGLMQQSFESCRRDYEITVPWLDELADLAQEIPGVLGVGIQGGGFGGFAMILVEEKAAGLLAERLFHHYYKPRGLADKKDLELKKVLFAVSPSRGAGLVLPEFPTSPSRLSVTTGLEEHLLSGQEISDLEMVFHHLAMRTREGDIPKPLDVLIVPGSPDYQIQAHVVAEAYKRFHPRYVVVTGKGLGPVAEGTLLHQALVENGVPADPDRLLVDVEATHTGENAQFSAQLLTGKQDLQNLGRPLRVGLVPIALAARIALRFFQKQFDWTSSVDFYLSPPEPPAITASMDPAVLKPNLDQALFIMRNLSDYRDKGFIAKKGRLGDLPTPVVAAAKRLKALQQHLAAWEVTQALTRLPDNPWFFQWQETFRHFEEMFREYPQLFDTFVVFLDQDKDKLGQWRQKVVLPRAEGLDPLHRELVLRYLVAVVNNAAWFFLKQPEDTSRSNAHILLFGPWAEPVKERIEGLVSPANGENNALVLALSGSMLYGRVTLQVGGAPPATGTSASHPVAYAEAGSPSFQPKIDRPLFGVDIGGSNLKFVILESGRAVDWDVVENWTLQERRNMNAPGPHDWSAQERDIAERGFASFLAEQVRRYVDQARQRGILTQTQLIKHIGISWPGPVRTPVIKGSVTIEKILRDLIRGIENGEIQGQSATLRQELDAFEQHTFARLLSDAMATALAEKGLQVHPYRDAFAVAFGEAVPIYHPDFAVPGETFSGVTTASFSLGTDIAVFLVDEKGRVPKDTFLYELARAQIGMDPNIPPHRSTGVSGTMRGHFGRDALSDPNRAEEVGKALVASARVIQDTLNLDRLNVTISGGNARQSQVDGAEAFLRQLDPAGSWGITFRMSPAMQATRAPEPLYTAAIGAAWASLAELAGLEERREVELPEFRLRLTVPTGVFGPTHESSQVLQEVLQRVRSRIARTPRGTPARVIDVGTGSGVAGLVATRLGAASVLATDLDSRAVEVAAENARRNGITEGFETAVGDELEPVAGRQFDLAIYNAHSRGTAGQFLADLSDPDRQPPLLADGGFALLGWYSLEAEGLMFWNYPWPVRALLTKGHFSVYAMARTSAELDALQELVTPGQRTEDTRVQYRTAVARARGTGLEETQVVRETLQRLLRIDDLVAAQRRAPEYTEEARRLAEEAVEGLLVAATAADVDLTDRAAVEAFLTPLVSSRAYVVATGYGSRFSPLRLMSKQLFPADGLVPNMKRALEPVVAFTTASPVAIIDGVVGYHLLAHKRLTPLARRRIVESIEQSWPNILAEAGVSKEELPWELVRSSIVPQLIYAGHPGQKRDLAAAGRAFEEVVSTRFPGVELEGRRMVLFEGFLQALFQPIVEWNRHSNQANPYLDPQKVERLVGRGAILALGTANGPGGALEAGYRRAEQVNLSPVAWDVPVQSDQAEVALPTVPNAYLIGFLKALASYRRGIDQAALLVVGGKLTDQKGPSGRGVLIVDSATKMPFIKQWKELTPGEQQQALTRWQNGDDVWLSLMSGFVVSHPFGRRAMADMTGDLVRWGHPDPKKVFRPEFWYTEWPAYRQLELERTGDTQTRVESFRLPEDAPAGLKDAQASMRFRDVARKHRLVPAVTQSPGVVAPPGLPLGAEVTQLDPHAIASLKNVEDLYAPIVAVLGPDDQPIRQFLKPGEFDGDLRRVVRARGARGPQASSAPVESPPTSESLRELVRHPEAYVPGATRLDQLDTGNQVAVVEFMRAEFENMAVSLLRDHPQDQAELLSWVETFLSQPETLTLTAEQVYQRFFQELRAWAFARGIKDPWAGTKQAYQVPVRAFALRLLDRVQAANTQPQLGALFDELALIATQANLIDSQSETAHRLFMRPGFFEDFERNVQTAVAKRLAINMLAQYRTLAMGERGTVLYVTDNFEEAYVDMAMAVLLTKLGHTVVMAGKAAPARGDATVDDLRAIHDELKAKAPHGLQQTLDQIQFISSGTESYGTFLHQATPAFRAAFKEARFIVLKGQGNLYTTVTMNALNTQAPVVCCLLSKGYTAQWVTGVPKLMNVLVDPAAEIYLVNRTGREIDIEAVIQDIFAGSDQIEILPGRLYVETTARIREGTAFEGTNVLLGSTTVGPGRYLKDVTATNTVFEGHPHLDAFSYEPPSWRTYGRVEHQTFTDQIVRWDTGLEEAFDAAVFARQAFGQAVLGRLAPDRLAAFLANDPVGTVRRLRQTEKYDAVFASGGMSALKNNRVAVDKNWRTASVVIGSDNGGLTETQRQVLEPVFGVTFPAGDITNAILGFVTPLKEEVLAERTLEHIDGTTFEAKVITLLKKAVATHPDWEQTDPDFVGFAVELLNLARLVDTHLVTPGWLTWEALSVRQGIFHAIMVEVGAYNRQTRVIDPERFMVGLYLLEQGLGIPHRVLPNSVDAQVLYARWENGLEKIGQVDISIAPDEEKRMPDGALARIVEFGFVDPVTADPELLDAIARLKSGGILVMGPSSFVVSLGPTLAIPAVMDAIAARTDVARVLIINVTRNNETVDWMIKDYVEFYERVTKRPIRDTVDYLIINTDFGGSEELREALGDHGGQPGQWKLRGGVPYTEADRQFLVHEKRFTQDRIFALPVVTVDAVKQRIDPNTRERPGVLIPVHDSVQLGNVYDLILSHHAQQLQQRQAGGLEEQRVALNSQRVLIVTPDGLPKLSAARFFDRESDILIEAIARDEAHQHRVTSGLEELGMKQIRVHNLETEFNGDLRDAVMSLQLKHWQQGRNPLVVTALSGLEEIAKFLGATVPESDARSLNVIIGQDQSRWM